MISLDDAKNAIRGGVEFGAVFPMLSTVEQQDELRRWFVYDLKREKDHEYRPAAPAPEPVVNGAQSKALVARAMGYTGDACAICQSVRMTRNGNCLKCEDCGSTSGCS